MERPRQIVTEHHFFKPMWYTIQIENGLASPSTSFALFFFSSIDFIISLTASTWQRNENRIHFGYFCNKNEIYVLILLLFTHTYTRA